MQASCSLTSLRSKKSLLSPLKRKREMTSLTGWAVLAVLLHRLTSTNALISCINRKNNRIWDAISTQKTCSILMKMISWSNSSAKELMCLINLWLHYARQTKVTILTALIFKTSQFLWNAHSKTTIGVRKLFKWVLTKQKKKKSSSNYYKWTLRYFCLAVLVISIRTLPHN